MSDGDGEPATDRDPSADTPRVAVVGAAMIDEWYAVSNLPEADGGAYASEVTTAVGGVGANVAVGLDRLGRDVGLVSRVGDDEYGRRALSSLADTSVDTSRVAIGDDSTTRSVILRAPDGERAIVTTGESFRRLTLDAAAIDAIRAADVVFLTAYTPDRVSRRILDVIDEMGRREETGGNDAANRVTGNAANDVTGNAANDVTGDTASDLTGDTANDVTGDTANDVTGDTANDAGAVPPAVVFDLSGAVEELVGRGTEPETIHRHLHRADLFVAGDVAAPAYFGGPEAAVERLAAARTAVGPAILTHGTDGMTVIADGGWTHVDAFDVDVVDTTGAGDGFLAGLIDRLLLDRSGSASVGSRGSNGHGTIGSGDLADADPTDLVDGVRFAAAVAAINCTERFTQPGLPTREEVAAFLAERG